MFMSRPGLKRPPGVDLSKPKAFTPLSLPYRSGGSGQRKPRLGTPDRGVQMEDTVLLFPAVDVRLHYFSNVDSDAATGLSPLQVPSPEFHSVFDDTSSTATATPKNAEAGRPIAAKKATKHAGLYVWLYLQALPQEMVLKPSLLDFLDQALEPIVVPGEDGPESAGGSLSDASSDVEVETGSSMVSSSMSEYSSFPVDVVVVFRVQPSDIRFSCLPVSRVECMLRLPALDVVFSSNARPARSSWQSPSRSFGKDSSRDRPDCSAASSSSYTFDNGGINVTICLSRFSFCIFHPYGKQHKGVGRTPSSDLEEGAAAEEGRARFHFLPAQPMSGKKDSLSLNVEFIKFNLSRKRLANSSVTGAEDLSGGSSSSIVKVSGESPSPQ